MRGVGGSILLSLIKEYVIRYDGMMLKMYICAQMYLKDIHNVLKMYIGLSERMSCI
jgi:hypothetical protein